MPIRKLQRKKAWEEVYDQIKHLIISGDWSPGYRLPAEIDLAVQLGVSRPTLREALRQLNLLGLIDIRHGEGNFVSHPEAKSFMTPLLPLLMRNKDNILQIMEARNMIEVTTASLAAERADEADMRCLAGYLEQMIESGNQREEFATNDHLFHKQIAKSTGNQIILQMYQAIEDLLMGQHLRNIGLPDAMKHGITEHQKIFAAIERRNAKEAGTAMREHLEHTMERIMTNMKGQ